MNRPAKIVCWSAGILVLLVVVVLIAARFLVTPEGVRQALLPLAEEKLGRPVDVGEIRIDLLTGITLDKISVSSDRNGPPLFQADQALLRYRFWPLLSGQVMIDRIRLQNPVVRLQRHPGGDWNLVELFGHASGQGEKPRVTQRSAQKNKGAEASPHSDNDFNLLVSNIELVGGRIEVTDQKLNPEAPYRFELKEVGLKVTNFSLTRPCSIEASLQLDAATLQLVGEVDPAGMKHDLQVKTDSLNLSSVSPYFRDVLPGIFSRASLTTDIRFTGGADRFDLKGLLALNGVYLVLDALEKAPIRNMSLELRPDLGVDRIAGLVTLRPSTVAVGEVGLQLSGTIERVEHEPFLDLKVSWQDVDLRELISAVPEGLLPRLDQVDPAGRLSGKLGLRGLSAQPETLLQAGRISLDGVQANLGSSRPALTGELTLVGSGLASENLNLRLGDDQAAVKFAIKDVAASPLQLQSRIEAGTVDLDRLFGRVDSGESAAVKEERTEKLAVSSGAEPPVRRNIRSVEKKEEPGPYDLPLLLDGSITAKEVLYQGLSIRDFSMGYHLADNLLDVRRFTGAVAGGRFSQKGKVNLGKKGLPYESTLKLESVNVEALINAFLAEMQGSLVGTLDFDAQVSGRGTTEASIKKNLTGDGRFTLVDGSANGTKISRGLVGLLGMKQLEKVNLHKADGTFTMAKGVIDFSADLAGRDLHLTPKGQVRLAGPVDISLPTRLAPSAAKKLGSTLFSRLLKDDAGWTVLPLKIKGTIESPEVTVDEKQLGRQAEKKVKEQIENKLLEKLAPAKGEGDTEDPTRKAIKDTLRGLFGK